ncbi:MAG: methionyl-tRNA formyltransferase, partial [Desulfatiglandales bacterium]
YCLHRGKEIRLFGPSSKNMGMDVEPGRVIMAKGSNLLIGTGNGILSLGEVQLSGKRRLPVSEFLKGYKIQEGEYFE